MSIKQVLQKRWPITRRHWHEWRGILTRHPASAAWLVPWFASQAVTRTPLGDEAPWIPFVARRWLARQLRPGLRVFEWGSGGSTMFLARRVAQLVSVEHDAEWYELVRGRLAALGTNGAREGAPRSAPSYRLILPRPLLAGEITAYGSGQPGQTHLDFEAYVRAIEEFPDAFFDLILIDGRARLACLGAALGKVRVGGHILLDNSNYPRYEGKLGCPANFERRDFPGVSPYRGAVWTQSTVFHRLR